MTPVLLATSLSGSQMLMLLSWVLTVHPEMSFIHIRSAPHFVFFFSSSYTSLSKLSYCTKNQEARILISVLAMLILQPRA